MNTNIYKRIKEFIATEILGKDTPSENEATSHIGETLRCLDDMLWLTLTYDEYVIIIHHIFDDVSVPFEDDKTKWLYGLAITKLKGDVLKVNQMNTSPEAEKYLGKKSITTGLENHLYRNARVELEKIYQGKNSGRLTSPYWRVRARQQFPQNQFSAC